MDFGTSNCIAGYLEDTPSGMKLKHVRLEDESIMLPSVLFVQQQNLPPLHVSEALLEVKLVAEELKEEQRIREIQANIESLLESYRRSNQPRVKSPDPGDYYLPTDYKKALQKYHEQVRALPVAIKRFEETELANYAEVLRAQLIKPVSSEQLKKRLKFQLARGISEERSRLLWDKTFFGALLSDEMVTLFGNTAIKEYSSDPMSGFLLRSPKAFLAVEIRSEHREIFVRALTRIFRHVREKAEAELKQSFNGLVVGRPVNFMGSNSSEGNRQAEEIIRESAQRAGYIEVRFVLEPLAAALTIRRKLLDTDDPVVVIDIGGGTTDVAYLEVVKDSDQNFFIKSVCGERIGGNDLDQAIAWSQISPFIGRGSAFKDGKPVPTAIISAALDTRDIPQQALFRRSFQEVEDFMQRVCSKDAKNIDRLYEVLLGQLQHRLLIAAEEMKIQSDGDTTAIQEFDMFESPFQVGFSRLDFANSCQDAISKLTSIVVTTLEASGTPDRPVRVFLTGGMSQNQVVAEAISAALPAGSSVDRLPAFRAIVGGLSIIANALNASPSVLLEPQVVRGVPISK